jgi:arginyl-tRNA synthetase
MNFRQKIIDLLAKNTRFSKEKLSSLLTVPPDSKLGDYAFPCFVLGKNPKEAAEKLKKKIKLSKFLSKIETVGPYLNFFVNQAILAEEVLKKVFKEKGRYGSGKSKKETVMVEFFHANTHKGVHIGHLRNISLGAAICNLQEAIGKKVIRVNYQGDIGPHVAKCLWGYLHFKGKEPKQHKGIWLGKIYTKASQKIKGKLKFEQEANELNKKIYQHDKSIEPLWKKTRKWCLDDFEYFYKQFGVKFNRLYFESETVEIGTKIAKQLLKQKIAKESEGAVVVDLNKYGLGIYVAITGQGTGTYQAKDLGLAQLKLKEFKFDKSLHVVGSEQQLYFKQIFKTFELMKSPLAKKSQHISYGLVMLPEGKMSSREGTMILYNNLYSELMRLSKQEIKKRHKRLSQKEIEKRAQMITFGALKYSMISRENQRDITFDWERSLDFEGDTGPYIQYAHARCASILRKANQKLNTNAHFESLNTEHEKKVIIHLFKFPETVLLSAEQYKPYLIAKYLLDLAQYFNEFYHNCPVISELTEVMHARLLLVDSVRQVLENGLNLLGIEAPKKM